MPSCASTAGSGMSCNRQSKGRPSGGSCRHSIAAHSWPHPEPLCSEERCTQTLPRPRPGLPRCETGLKREDLSELWDCICHTASMQRLRHDLRGLGTLLLRPLESAGGSYRLQSASSSSHTYRQDSVTSTASSPCRTL